jgi:hypothetical protein
LESAVEALREIANLGGPNDYVTIARRALEHIDSSGERDG